MNKLSQKNHFLFIHPTRWFKTSNLLIYDAVTEELIFKGEGIRRNLFISFLWYFFGFVFWIILSRIGGGIESGGSAYINLPFKNREGVKVFKFRRGTLGWVIKVVDEQQKRIGKYFWSKVTVIGGEKYKLKKANPESPLHTLIINKSGQQIGTIRRSVKLFGKFIPTNKETTERSYDGEIIFENTALDDKTKMVLLTSLFFR